MNNVTSTMPSLYGENIRMKFFSSVEKCGKHVCNHLLIMPEYAAWSVAHEAFAQSYGDASEDQRWQLQKEVLADEAEGQKMSLLYREICKKDAQVIAELGWVWRETTSGKDRPAQRTYMGLSLSGILMIVTQDVLVTAYIPGFGDSAQVATGEMRKDSCKRGMRTRRRVRQTVEKANRPVQERLGKASCPRHFIFRTAYKYVRREKETQYIISEPSATAFRDIAAAARDVLIWQRLVDEVASNNKERV